MECPQCGVQIQGKSLTRNSSYSTMVQCITKIRNLINGIPVTQPSSSNDQAEVLMDVLKGIVDNDDTDIENSLENGVHEKEMVNELKSKKSLVKKDEVLKVKKPEIATKNTVEPVKPAKKFGLLLTGLSEDQKMIIQSNLQQLSKLSGKHSFKVVKDYSPDSVSHIICACAPKSYCPRTLKYLLGIAGKAWIVSFDWVLESLAARKLLDENKFVIVGDEAVQCDTNACEKSRIDSGKLFDGRRFYLAGLFNAPGPSKSDLTNLIQIAGGIISKKQEEGCFVVSNNSNGPKEGEMPYTWLFDAVSLYKI